MASIIWTDSFWGTIECVWDGTTYYSHWYDGNQDDQVLFDTSGILYYKMRRNGGDYQFGQAGSTSDLYNGGTVTMGNIIFITGSSLETGIGGSYIWNSGNSRWENGSY